MLKFSTETHFKAKSVSVLPTGNREKSLGSKNGY